MKERGAVLRPQPWDWPGPRVLLEQPYRADSSARVDALRRAGYAVALCPGPTPDDRCPLAGEEGCAAAHGADVVVSSLELEPPEARESLVALRAHLPRLPVLVEVDREVATRWPELVQECDRLEPAVSPEELVFRVGEALERRLNGFA